MVFNSYQPTYFKEKEFNKCTPSCRMSDMDDHFLQMLDTARDIAEVPFYLNSAFRTKAWELSRGRSGTSSHCEGKAVDIHFKDMHTCFRIVSGLLAAGFTRIGIDQYRNFIHVDCSGGRQNQVIWFYDK